MAADMFLVMPGVEGETEDHKYKGEKGHKPEYETIGSFGGMLLQDDFAPIQRH